MIKNLFRKWLGLDALQAEKEALQIARDKAVAETVIAQEKEEKAKMDPKARATARGEPYVAVLSMDVDPNNLHQGAFELDWNEIFVARLIKAGYQGKVDADIVDQWFQNV